MSTKERAIRHHDHVTSIHLRPIGESDLSVLERLAVDPLISGPFDWHGFGDPGALRRRLAEDGFLGRDPHNLAVALDQDDGCIGDVSWLAIPTGPTSACWNIGVTILPEFRGKGYGTAAQRLLAEYLFATTTVNRVEAGTDVDNVAEQRASSVPFAVRTGIQRAPPISTSPASARGIGTSARWLWAAAVTNAAAPMTNSTTPTASHLRRTLSGAGGEPASPCDVRIQSILRPLERPAESGPSLESCIDASPPFSVSANTPFSSICS